MENSRKVLIADDDPVMRRAYRSMFEAEGFSVTVAKDGDEAVAKFAECRPDVVLLDVMMPRKNGLAACAEIRSADPLVPILFFTAMPTEATLVRGLGFGADDYIDKERSPEEFLARVRAALRRRDAESESATPAGEVLSLDDVKVDFATMTAKGGAVDERLTKSEAVVLRLLSGTPGRVFSFDEIFAALGGDGYVGDANAVRVLVHRLKAKLGRAGNLIVSSRGVGYRLVR